MGVEGALGGVKWLALHSESRRMNSTTSLEAWYGSRSVWDSGRWDWRDWDSAQRRDGSEIARIWTCWPHTHTHTHSVQPHGWSLKVLKEYFSNLDRCLYISCLNYSYIIGSPVCLSLKLRHGSKQMEMKRKTPACFTLLPLTLLSRCVSSHRAQAEITLMTSSQLFLPTRQSLSTVTEHTPNVQTDVWANETHV